MSYAELYGRALRDPEGFWMERAGEIPWLEPPPQALSGGDDHDWRWFAGGKTNTAWLALDRHVDAGRGDVVALIYDSPATGQVVRYTYAELTDAGPCVGSMCR